MNQITPNKTLENISHEWNSICAKREQLICSGQDISLEFVTAPCIIKNIQEEAPSLVIDVGCGTGFLTNKIASFCDLCYGIDISETSINIAKLKYNKANLQFMCSSISEFSPQIQFDCCVSNMVFMTDPEWKQSLARINKLLKQYGVLFIMITHPLFWPKYWGYENKNWFDYNREIYIEHDFHTSVSEAIGITTHIHRPIDMYIDEICNAGFCIERTEEPSPTISLPPGYSYEYPRFLLFKCRKI